MHKLQSIKRESIHKRSLLFLRWNWKLEPLHCFYGREHKQGISIANSIPHLMAQQILYYEQQTNAGYKIEYNHNLKVEKSLTTINQIPKLEKKGHQTNKHTNYIYCHIRKNTGKITHMSSHHDLQLLIPSVICIQICYLIGQQVLKKCRFTTKAFYKALINVSYSLKIQNVQKIVSDMISLPLL